MINAKFEKIVIPQDSPRMIRAQEEARRQEESKRAKYALRKSAELIDQKSRRGEDRNGETTNVDFFAKAVLGVKYSKGLREGEANIRELADFLKTLRAGEPIAAVPSRNRVTGSVVGVIAETSYKAERNEPQDDENTKAVWTGSVVLGVNKLVVVSGSYPREYEVSEEVTPVQIPFARTTADENSISTELLLGKSLEETQLFIGDEVSVDNEKLGAFSSQLAMLGNIATQRELELV